jgi:hypothetical protein
VKVSTCKIGDLQRKYPRLGVSSFQRALVWRKPQRAGLIRSLVSEYPTGTIILNRLGSSPRSGRGPVSAPLASSHDVIDGQQRLTTILSFVLDPTQYFTDWAKRAPYKSKPEETLVIEQVRVAIDDLERQLRPARAGYVPSHTDRADFRSKLETDIRNNLVQHRAGNALTNPAFHSVCDKLARFCSAVESKKLVIEELTGLADDEAEAIFHVINTSGTDLRWWELLGEIPQFKDCQYVSHTPYQTARDSEVVTLALRRRNPGAALPAHPTLATSSFWSAMFSLGEYYDWWLAGADPMPQPRLLPETDPRRLKVDGLGFRLVSAFLSHDVGRAAVYSIFDYPQDVLREAIDVLFGTADVLFRSPSRSSPDFRLLPKYSLFRSGAIPAYPLIGIIVAAARHVGQNAAASHGLLLSNSDRASVRSLTEELFREVVCTKDWAGTGDKKLKDWLGSHFPVIPTSGISALPAVLVGSTRTSYSRRTWFELLRSLSPMGRRGVDRRSASLHFWVQYLLDSKVSGCLPVGDVHFDHIVPVNRTNGSLTTHPLNFTAVSERVNLEKGVKSYRRWSPTPTIDAEYRRYALCDLPIPSKPANASADFLAHANLGDLREMINERAKVFEYALGTVLPEWISSGDR